MEFVRVWNFNGIPRSVDESNALQIGKEKEIRTNSCNSGFHLSLSGTIVQG